MINILYEESLYGKFGKFKVSGKVEGETLEASAHVIVKGITGVQTFSTATTIGIAPELPDKLAYTVDVEWGNDPVITASVNNNASVTIVYPKNKEELAKVIVTAENGVDTKTYTIRFNELPKAEELDLSYLEFLVKYADELVKNGDLSETIPIVVKQFNDELKKAKELIVKAKADPSSVTQEQIDERQESLRSVISLIEFKGNKTKLQRLVTMAKQEIAKKETYTKKTYLPFEQMLEKAITVLADKTALKDEIDKAWNGLAYAYAGLRKIPNKDILKATLDKAKAIDGALYTSESYENMKSIMKKAQVVFDKEDVSQEEVDVANKNLENAITDLVSLENKSSEAKNEKPSTNGKGPKTGDMHSGVFVLLIVLLLASTIIIFGKRKHFRDRV